MLCGCGDVSRCDENRWKQVRIQPISLRVGRLWLRWKTCVRGDVHRLRAPRDARGSEQQGARYAVVVQSDDLLLSTVLVAPTSKSAVPRIFRPTITLNNERTQVLIEQTTAVAPERLGALVGHVSRDELDQISEALRLAFALD
jgi:mRNA interferase MazF